MNQTYGHTPIGIYNGYLAEVKSDTSAFGPYRVIRIEGVSGYVAEQCSHRDGLMIHGGREEDYEGMEVGDPDFTLHHTEGCVRVTNEYQLQLQNEITALIEAYHRNVGIVIITQNGLTTLSGG